MQRMKKKMKLQGHTRVRKSDSLSETKPYIPQKGAIFGNLT